MKIAAFAPNEWSGPWMNRQQLLSRLALRHDVVYSNGCPSIWEKRQNTRQFGKWLGEFRSANGVDVDFPSPLLLRWPRFGLISEMVERLYSRRLDSHLMKLGQPNDKRVSYVFHPSLYSGASKMRSDILVYHAYDLYQSTPGWNDEMDKMERALLDKADFVFASSMGIRSALQEKAGKEVIFLPNGVDEALFFEASSSPEKPDPLLENVDLPMIGYTGNINRKVDLDLIHRLAVELPSLCFVLVGRVANLDDQTTEAFKKCQLLDNILFLGHQHHSQLPSLMASMTVNLMSYRLADDLWTEGIYPLKMHEYLAVGRPVVSARIPAVLEFESAVTIADDLDDWVNGINTAMQESDPELSKTRIEIATRNTWSHRVADIEARLENF